MKPWVKAGIWGGILQIVFTAPIILIYFLPVGIGSFVALCTCCLFLFTYPVPGILCIHWTPLPQIQDQGIKTSAFAGLLATGLDSIATLLLVLGVSIAGLNEKYIGQFMPNVQESVDQSGLGFWFSTSGVLLQSCFSLIFHIVFGTIISVLGGMIYSSMKKR